MSKKTQKKYVALSLLIALVLFTLCNPGASKAETTTGIKETISCTVDGVERTLTWSEDGYIYFKIGDSEPTKVYSDTSLLSIKFDAYGTCWVYENDNYGENQDDYVLRWWNYDILPDHKLYTIIPRPTDEDRAAYVNDIESLILDSDNKFIIGYKTFSGESYAIPTPEDMEKILSTDNYLEYPLPKSLVTPSPIEPTPTPDSTITPTPTPPQDLTPTPTPPSKTDTTTQNQQNTVKQPTVTQNSSTTSKTSSTVSIKKSSGYTCLSVGNKVVSKYKLKKGVLTWKGTKKIKKVKQVKQVGFIKKSKNLIYITKKDKAYTISKNGKTKTILKKGAKKLIFKNGYVTKIKKKSGYTSVVNK